MNAANIIPLGASYAVRYAKREHPATVDPVHVRFDAFELDEANALLLRNGQAVALAPEPFALPAPSPDECACALPTLLRSNRNADVCIRDDLAIPADCNVHEVA